MQGKQEGKRRGQQKMRRLDGITGFKGYESEQTQGYCKDREPKCTAVHGGPAGSQTWLSD